MTARATLTIKSRPRADGTVRWFLWIRRPRPERDEFIDVDGISGTSEKDRAAVEAFAKPYRDALKGGHSDAETCDQWYDRFIKSRMGKVSTASTDHQQWLKWISPHLGKKPIAGISADEIETVRDALTEAIEAWEAADKKRGVGLASRPRRTCGASSRRRASTPSRARVRVGYASATRTTPPRASIRRRSAARSAATGAARVG